MEAMKTIRQDDLATAQGVKTLGRRNTKPTAYGEVVDDYIQHVNTPVDDERHQLRTEQEDGVDAGEGRQRWRCRGSGRPM
jgi:hypothetical protein